jgi:hypothetical protein
LYLQTSVDLIILTATVCLEQKISFSYARSLQMFHFHYWIQYQIHFHDFVIFVCSWSCTMCHGCTFLYWRRSLPQFFAYIFFVSAMLYFLLPLISLISLSQINFYNSSDMFSYMILHQFCSLNFFLSLAAYWWY